VQKMMDSDDDDFRVQALPVSSAPVSLDGPPTSADEYLRRVKCAAALLSLRLSPPPRSLSLIFCRPRGNRCAEMMAPAAGLRRSRCPTC
jgi:hypothetical protein